jgi:hypothetical protein
VRKVIEEAELAERLAGAECVQDARAGNGALPQLDATLEDDAEEAARLTFVEDV